MTGRCACGPERRIVFQKDYAASACSFPLAHYLALHTTAVNTKKKPGNYQVRLAKWVVKIGAFTAKPEDATYFGGVLFEDGPVGRAGDDKILFGFQRQKYQESWQRLKINPARETGERVPGAYGAQTKTTAGQRNRLWR